MVIAYIGLGSNLGNRRKNIEKALDYLNKIDSVKVIKVSQLIETKPAGGPKQGKYLNAAAEIKTELSPEQLLESLKEIEKRLGRKQARVKWGPREIDLDILFYGDKKIGKKDLKIPHPYLHERYFVLKPLSEIAPEFIHPKIKKTVSQMLFELEDEWLE